MARRRKCRLLRVLRRKRRAARRRTRSAGRDAIRSPMVDRSGRAHARVRVCTAGVGGAKRRRSGAARRRPLAEGRLMRPSGSDGFSVVELIVSLSLTLVVTAAIFDLVGQARRSFDAEPEAADRQQRIRVAVDTLLRDLLMA